MKQITLILMFVFMMNFLSAQEIINIKYEPNTCVQQYFYKAADNSGSGAVKELYDFHVQLNGKEKTVIRTKKVGTYPLSSLETVKMLALTTCENKKTHTFQSMVGKIVSGDQEVFFMEEEGDQYHLYKGIRATYDIYHQDYYYSYSPDYRLKYTYNNHYDPFQKLLHDKKSGITTIFSGKSKLQCYDQFGVVILPEAVSSTQVNVEYLKNVGIYSEKRGADFFTLEKLDGTPIKEYLNSQCSGGRPVSRNVPDGYNKLSGGNNVKGGAANPNPKFELLASYNNFNPSNQSDNGIKGGASAAPVRQNVKSAVGSKAKFEVIASFDKKGENIKRISKPDVKPLENKENKKLDKTEFPIPTEYNFQSEKPTGAITHEYIVKPKDTLYGLSKKFNVTINDLITWNNLKDITILTDQKLVVGTSKAPL